MNNQIVRGAMEKHSCTQWKLAELMGISEFTLSRRLRHELPEEEQKKMASLIEEEAKRK